MSTTPDSTKPKKSILKNASIRSGLSTVHYVETWVVVPPDGGWGWFVVFVAFMCNFLVDGAVFTFGIFLDDIGKSLDAHPRQVALATSVLNGLYYFAGPITCALINRLGFRIVTILGGLIAAVTYLAASMIHDLTAFILVLGIFGGIGFNFVYSPCMLVVGFYFERWRALATAISVTGTAFGLICFPPMIAKVMGNMHWRKKFRVFSGLFVSIMLMGLAFRPIKPTKIIEERKVKTLYEIDEDDDESIGSSDSVGRGCCSRIYHRFHNLLFPTVAQVASDPELLYGLDKDSDFDITTLMKRRFSESSVVPAGSICLSVTAPTEYKAEVLEKKCCECCQCPNDGEITRPLYRDDILYPGSVSRLPIYVKSRASIASAGPSTKSSIRSSVLSYHMAVTRTMSRAELEETARCAVCPESVLRALVTMMDVRLFKSKAFLTLTISGFLTNMGMYLPYTYYPARGNEIGMSADWISVLLSAIGISNALARLLCGIVSSFPRVDIFRVSWITTLICGISIMTSYGTTSVEGQLTCAIIFGLSISSFTALRSVLLVEMLGLENLTNAFGITIMFYGVGCAIGPILAGEIEKASGSYGYIFIFAGLLISLSGILLIPLSSISRAEKRQKKKSKNRRVR